MERSNVTTTVNYKLLGKVYGLLAFAIAMSILGSIAGLHHLSMVNNHFWLFVILVFVLDYITYLTGKNKHMALISVVLLGMLAFIIGFTFITTFTLITGLAQLHLLSLALSVNPSAIVYTLITTTAMFILMSLITIIFRASVLNVSGFLFIGIIAIIEAVVINLSSQYNVFILIGSIVVSVLFNLTINYNTARVLGADIDAELGIDEDKQQKHKPSAIELTLDLLFTVFSLFVNNLFLILKLLGDIRI